MIAEKHYDNLGEYYLNTFVSDGMSTINKAEINLILARLDMLIKEKNRKINVLELGIGPGRIAVEVVKRDVKYTGIDISDTMINISKKRLGDIENTHIFKRDIATGLPFKNNLFDLVYSIRVLKYLNIKDIEKVLHEINRILDDNGIFIFSIPNKRSLNLFNLSPKVPYIRFSEKEIVRLLEITCFENIKIIGGAKFPDFIYLHSCKLLLYIVLKIENIFKFTNIGSRSFYIYAEKCHENTNCPEIKIN